MSKSFYIKAKAPSFKVENYPVERIARLDTNGKLDLISTYPVLNSNVRKIENNIIKCSYSFNSDVNSIVVDSNGKMLVGGVFTTYQGVAANRIIRLNADGSRDTSFNIGIGFNSTVLKITIDSNGKILVGGSFTSYQGLASNYIIRLNSDGSRDASFNIGTGFNNKVTSILINYNGKILVGGAFITYKGVIEYRLVRLNSDGSRDTSFNVGSGFDNDVNSIAIDSNEKILVVGWLEFFQGIGTKRIIRLNSDGSRDTSFNVGTGFDNTSSKIAIDSNGKIVVVGYFTSYQGFIANKIIRLNSDGSRDTSFNIGTGFDLNVYFFDFDSNGKILVGGVFTSYQGVAANRIIRLNADGSRDTNFITGNGFSSGVNTIVLDSNGKVLVGGSFVNYNNF